MVVATAPYDSIVLLHSYTWLLKWLLRIFNGLLDHLTGYIVFYKLSFSIGSSINTLTMHCHDASYSTPLAFDSSGLDCHNMP